MKKIIKLTAFLVLTVLVITGISCSRPDFAGLGKGKDSVPLTQRALTGNLPNGLRYFIMENTLPQNRAHVALVVNAGSVLERDDQRGFAHFVEHMAFKGTERFPEMELIDYLRSLGMRFGPDANAYTSYDETVYHFDVPVEIVDGEKRIPERALAILDDWTHRISFREEDTESERRVVLEELRSRLGAMERARKIMLPILFQGSAFADRDVIGLSEVLENASSEQLIEFYNRWYRSDNMALVFVGDFNGKALEAELYRHFNMQKASEPVNRPIIELPPPKNGNFQVEVITDPEITSTTLMIYYKQKRSGQRGTVSYYRNTIIDFLITTMLSMRFEERILDPKSASSDLWGHVWRWSHNARFYSMGAEPKTGSTEQALMELLYEKESMRRHGFTLSELERAKLSLVSYMEKLLSEKDKTESRSYIRGFTQHFLFGEDMADIEWEVDAVNALLEGINLRDISIAAKNYFSANDIIIFITAPQAEEESLPSPQRIREIYREYSRIKIDPRKDEKITGELLDFIPAAGTITQEIKDDPADSYIITLSNGAKIILKETENRNNEVILYAMANGGTANASRETIVSVSLLSEMLNVSGLGKYSRAELINKLMGKQISFSFWNSNYYRGFQGSSTTQDLTTLFEMIHLFFTDPRLDESAIEAMIDQYRTTLAHQDDNPQRYFSRELTRVINNNHPLFMPLELDDLQKVSIEQSREFLSRCLNPGDYTFIFTGNFDRDVIRDYLKTYIASIPASASMNRWINPGIGRPNEGRRTIYKGVDERSIVYIGWFSQGPSDFNERRNQSASILSEYLDIVLTNEIREKLGGVYSISAGASVTVIPQGELRLSVHFVCDPARSGELIQAVKNIITDFSRQGVSDDTFNKAREAMLMQHDRSIQQNLHIAQSFANSFVLYNTPLDRLNTRPQAIRSVTQADIQNLCRQIIAAGALELVLLPER